MVGIELIAAERKRQVEEEGFTEEYDDSWKKGELSDAALCYCLSAETMYYLWKRMGWEAINELWPFGGRFPECNKRVQELTKAGALIAAEIDRLQRLEGRNKE